MNAGDSGEEVVRGMLRHPDVSGGLNIQPTAQVLGDVYMKLM